jgi:hypothetical protein
MQRPMNRFKTAFALLVVFFAGCAAERLLVVPPAHAGTAPERWEYFCTHKWDDDRVTQMANEAGQKGWEMAGVGASGNVDPIWCFKRPLP